MPPEKKCGSECKHVKQENADVSKMLIVSQCISFESNFNLYGG
jgi:hypothetical protein